MDLIVAGNGVARFAGRSMRCAIGRGGISRDKREGDGITPAGAFACRLVYWRPDRLVEPRTALRRLALTPDDGWCDAPGDPEYNRPVRLPHAAGAETLWREDGVYDLIVPLGYNDDPAVPGLGSAIFLHVARPGYTPTEGCVALAREDLMAFLEGVEPQSQVIVRD